MNFNPSPLFAVVFCSSFFAASFCLFSAVFILRVVHRWQSSQAQKMQATLKHALMKHLVQGDPLPSFITRERTLALALVQEFSQHIDSDRLLFLRNHLQLKSGAKDVASLQTMASYSAGSL